MLSGAAYDPQLLESYRLLIPKVDYTITVHMCTCCSVKEAQCASFKGTIACRI